MQLYNTTAFFPPCRTAKPLVFSWLLPKALIHWLFAVLKSTKKKNGRKRLLFENSHSINKIALIQINFPTLALEVVITVHITTYKCRQTIAEVRLSHRVNWDTRQTRERKIHCQAKNVKTQTTAFPKTQSSGCLRGERLPEMLKYDHEIGEPLGDSFFFFCFKSLNILIFLSIMIFFFLIPHFDFSKFRAESHVLSCGGQCVRLPQARGGGYSAGGLVAGADGDGALETIRHDNGRPAAWVRRTYEDALLKCSINKEGGWFTASWHSFQGKYQRIWFFLRFPQTTHRRTFPSHQWRRFLGAPAHLRS